MIYYCNPSDAMKTENTQTDETGIQYFHLFATVINLNHSDIKLLNRL